MRGLGRAVFVAVLLMIAGTLNIIYGIAAVSDAQFFTNTTQYVFSGLHTWGWITVILGVIQVTAGFSLFAGGSFGRVIVSLFVLFNCFAIVQWKQYRTKGKWADYLYGERRYIVLSLVAKSALAWQIFAGALAAG